MWEMVVATIRQGASYAPSFYILLIIAGLIGAVGILTNSQILIVGAMVVGPINAIIAVALGIYQRDRAEVRDGLLALCWGFLAAIARDPAVRPRRSARRARPRPPSCTACGRSRT